MGDEGAEAGLLGGVLGYVRPLFSPRSTSSPTTSRLEGVLACTPNASSGNAGLSGGLLSPPSPSAFLTSQPSLAHFNAAASSATSRVAFVFLSLGVLLVACF